MPLAKRPSGSRLLHDATQHKFKLVLVYKLDRFGRDTLDTLQAIKYLDQYKIEMRSATENFNSNTPSSRFQLNIMSSTAEYEKALIVERITDGKASKSKSGLYTGGVVGRLNWRFAVEQLLDSRG